MKTLPDSRSRRRKARGVLVLPSRGAQARRRIPIPPTQKDTATWFDFSQLHPIETQKGENFYEVDDKDLEKYEHLGKQKQSSSPVSTSDASSVSTSDWVITIRDKLEESLIGNKSTSCLDHCIFKVPRNLREIDSRAYSPQIVSIGPYHRGKSCLEDMEKHKWRLLHHVLERTEHQLGELEHQLEIYLEAMLLLEEKTRRCYSSSFKGMSSREFVEMMLLDACFILEFLRVSVKGFIYCGYSWGDPLFTSRGVLPCIQRDLLMLENQLPLFVLDRVFSLTCEPDETDSVSQMALQFFDSMVPGCSKAAEPEDPGLHFVHIVRRSLIPTAKPTFGCVSIKKVYQPQLMMHCVTTLRESGVKFQKKNSHLFMDIEFKNGVLHIPPLVIHDSTKAIFLNLMVFEQCYPHCSNHVTSYVSFMDGLIHSPGDVGILRHEGIIDHGLGSEERVACLFNNICRELAFNINDCYLSRVSIDVKTHFDLNWNKWRATLKHDYFRNPWAIVSLLVAILLIGLTALQTFYGVYGYYVQD